MLRKNWKFASLHTGLVSTSFGGFGSIIYTYLSLAIDCCPPVLLVLCPLVLAVLAVSYILIHLLLSIGVHQFWRFWLHVFIPCCIYPLLSHQVKRSKPGGTVKKSERLYVSIFLHPEFDLRSFFFFKKVTQKLKSSGSGSARWLKWW